MASKVELWKLDINNYDNLVMMGSRNCIEGYFFIFQSHISSLYIFGPSEIDILRWNSSSTPGTIEKYYLNNGLGKLASSIDSNPKRLVEHVFVMHSDSPSFILVLQNSISQLNSFRWITYRDGNYFVQYDQFYGERVKSTLFFDSSTNENKLLVFCSTGIDVLSKKGVWKSIPFSFSNIMSVASFSSFQEFLIFLCSASRNIAILKLDLARGLVVRKREVSDIFTSIPYATKLEVFKLFSKTLWIVCASHENLGSEYFIYDSATNKMNEFEAIFGNGSVFVSQLSNTPYVICDHLVPYFSSQNYLTESSICISHNCKIDVYNIDEVRCQIRKYFWGRFLTRLDIPQVSIQFPLDSNCIVNEVCFSANDNRSALLLTSRLLSKSILVDMNAPSNVVPIFPIIEDRFTIRWLNYKLAYKDEWIYFQAWENGLRYFYRDKNGCVQFWDYSWSIIYSSFSSPYYFNSRAENIALFSDICCVSSGSLVFVFRWSLVDCKMVFSPLYHEMFDWDVCQIEGIRQHHTIYLAISFWEDFQILICSLEVPSKELCMSDVISRVKIYPNRLSISPIVSAYRFLIFQIKNNSVVLLAIDSEGFITICNCDKPLDFINVVPPDLFTRGTLVNVQSCGSICVRLYFQDGYVDLDSISMTFTSLFVPNSLFLLPTNCNFQSNGSMRIMVGRSIEDGFFELVVGSPSEECSWVLTRSVEYSLSCTSIAKISDRNIVVYNPSMFYIVDVCSWLIIFSEKIENIAISSIPYPFRSSIGIETSAFCVVSDIDELMMHIFFIENGKVIKGTTSTLMFESNSQHHDYSDLRCAVCEDLIIFGWNGCVSCYRWEFHWVDRQAVLSRVASMSNLWQGRLLDIQFVPCDHDSRKGCLLLVCSVFMEGFYILQCNRSNYSCSIQKIRRYLIEDSFFCKISDISIQLLSNEDNRDIENCLTLGENGVSIKFMEEELSTFQFCKLNFQAKNKTQTSRAIYSISISTPLPISQKAHLDDALFEIFSRLESSCKQLQT